MHGAVQPARDFADSRIVAAEQWLKALLHHTMVTALLVTATVGVRTQDVTFSSRIEAVRVDVLVTDNGRPLRGLGPADFEIRDNGVLQHVDLVSFDQVPLNAILALDMSDSVAGERLDRLRAAGSAVLAGLQPADQSALVTFSHVVRLAAKLTHDAGVVRAALSSAAGMGNTALLDGTYAGITVGATDAGRELLIVFSDGIDTSSWLTADKVLDAARRSDVVVYAVSVRSPTRPDFLRDLTALTSGRLFEVERTENLDTVFVSILEEFRHRYLVSYTPHGVSREGWHKLDVRVKQKAVTRARPGYLSAPSAAK
jgi:Ca-activated chloride channel family protein